MTCSSPLATVWGALERRDCSPRGPSHDFRARCPGHDGDNALSLHVAEGADQRVLLHCFAHHCTPEQIVEALGLSIVDLFPAGHRRARRTSFVPVRRSDLTGAAQVIANTLAALDVAGMQWQAMVMTACPFCGSPGAWLRTNSDDDPIVDCPNGCTTGEFTQALAYRLSFRSGDGKLSPARRDTSSGPTAGTSRTASSPRSLPVGRSEVTAR